MSDSWDFWGSQNLLESPRVPEVSKIARVPRVPRSRLNLRIWTSTGFETVDFEPSGTQTENTNWRYRTFDRPTFRLLWDYADMATAIEKMISNRKFDSKTISHLRFSSWRRIVSVTSGSQLAVWICAQRTQCTTHSYDWRRLTENLSPSPPDKSRVEADGIMLLWVALIE